MRNLGRSFTRARAPTCSPSANGLSADGRHRTHVHQTRTGVLETGDRGCAQYTVRRRRRNGLPVPSNPVRSGPDPRDGCLMLAHCDVDMSRSVPRYNIYCGCGCRRLEATWSVDTFPHSLGLGQARPAKPTPAPPMGLTKSESEVAGCSGELGRPRAVARVSDARSY